MTRGLPKGEDFFDEGNSPKIGVFESTEMPAYVLDPFPGITFWIAMSSLPGGWLYIHVAIRTVEEPIRNEGVIWKPKRATEARKERTMDRLVAKPLRMLSEYLITMAVTSPPNTWIATVAHAHAPK